MRLLFCILAGMLIFECSNNTSSSPIGSDSSSSSFDNSGDGNYSSSSSSNGTFSSSSGGVSSSSSSMASSSSSAASSSSSRAASSSSGISSQSLSSSSIQVTGYSTLVEGQAGVMKGWTSRYWDGCKPSCTWPDKAMSNDQDRNGDVSKICKNCDKNDNEVRAYYWKDEWNKYYTDASSCDNEGTTYTCWDMAPVAVNDTLAYAFAATPGSGNQCGKCFQIQFDGGWQDAEARVTHKAIKGKTLIVMSSNIGHDVSGGQFDVLIPGGGVGAFDSFSKQLNISVNDLGEQFGGLLRTCDNEINGWNATLEQWQTCLRNKCNAVFGSKSKLLLDGCLWQANWYMAANNPTVLYKEVTCPEYLVQKYTPK
jgi:hypothetical protein